MHRFFVPSPIGTCEQLSITGDAAHQICRVLRLRPGDDVALFDGDGAEYRARLVSVSPGGVVAVHVETARPNTELAEPLTLAMALIQHAKFELVVQKATELGVTTIQPVAFERSHSSGAVRVGSDRMARWRAVAREAAEQSGRVRLPDVREPLPFSRLLPTIDGGSSRLFHPHATLPAPDVAPCARPSTLIVGPEGGLATHELGRARDAGIRVVAMGCRIMRAETAAIAAVALEVAARETWEAP